MFIDRTLFKNVILYYYEHNWTVIIQNLKMWIFQIIIKIKNGVSRCSSTVQYVTVIDGVKF